MGDLALFITTKAKPGRRDELFALDEKILAPRAEANEGQRVVVWAADQHDPDTYHLFEIYDDPDAMGANAEADWFADYMAAAGPLLAAEPTVAVATPRWTTGLWS